MTSLLAKAGRQIWSRQRAMLGDERGVTAVEFAFLGVPFFAIIGAIMQTAVIFLSSQVLESSVNDAARKIRTGQTQSSGGTLASFRTAVCNGLYGLFPDCSGLHIRVSTVSDFQSTGTSLPLNPSCAAPCNWSVPEAYINAGGGAVVQVQVYYRYPVLLPLGALGMSNMGDGRRLIGASTVFKTEPFPS